MENSETTLDSYYGGYGTLKKPSDKYFNQVSWKKKKKIRK